MASKSKKNDSSNESVNDDFNDDGGALPEGFEPVSVEGKQTWWKPEKGAIVQGNLIGRFQRRKGKGFFYQVELTAPSIGTRGSGEDAETIELDPGEIICLDEREALKDLKAIVEDENRKWEVYIKAVVKIRLDNGNNFWRFKVGKKPAKNPDKVPF